MPSFETLKATLCHALLCKVKDRSQSWKASEEPCKVLDLDDRSIEFVPGSLQPVLATPWRASCDAMKKDYLHTSLAAGQLGPQSATSNSQRRMFSTHAALLETAGPRRHVEREPSPPVSCEHFCLVPFVDSYTSAQGLSS